MQDSTPVAAYISAVITTAFSVLHPWASTGAAFGCFFFLSVSSLLSGAKRIQLLIFSWGIGYASGVFWNGDGPPYSKEPMLIAAAVSALASVIFTAFYHIIDNGEPLTPWLNAVLERVPFLTKKER